jgi:DNA-binding transcriptional LysR family regulator
MNLGFAINAASECEGAYAGMALVAAGVGVTLLPSSLSKTPHRGIVFRQTHSPLLYQRMGIAYRQERQTAVMKLFLRVARKVASQYRHVGDSQKNRTL